MTAPLSAHPLFDPQAPSAPAPTPRIGLGRALRAELQRARRSAASRLVWLGLAICLVQGVAWLGVATGAPATWSSLFAWQTLYGTGLVGAIAGLHAGLVVGRERAAREGGTWARPLPPGTALIARVLVMALQAALLNAAATFPLVAFGPLVGLTEVPWDLVASLWLVLTCAFLPPMVIGMLCARIGGTITAVLVGLVWQVAGVVLAEGPLGAMAPFSWGVRALMPVIGIHANGTGLEPASPVRAWAWGLDALGCVAFAAALTLLLAIMARVDPASPARLGLVRGLLARLTGRGAAQQASVGAADQGLPAAAAVPIRERLAALATPTGALGRRPVAADLQVLRRTAAWPLVGFTVLVFALCALVWGHSRVTGLEVWAAIPLGTCILASILASTTGAGWRVTALRRTAAEQAAATGAVCALLLSVVVGAGMLLALVSGGEVAEVLRTAVLAWAVGAAALAVDLFLAMRFGAGAAFGVTLVALVLSMVLGGTQIARTPAWAAGFFGWPVSADSAGRVAIALLACAVIAAAGMAGYRGALRRAASLA